MLSEDRDALESGRAPVETDWLTGVDYSAGPVQVVAQPEEIPGSMTLAAQGDFTAVSNVLNSGDIASIQRLLSARDTEGRTILHWAALCDQVELTASIIRRAGGIDTEASAAALVHISSRDTQQTALHWAVIKGSLGVLSLLRRAGAELRARDSLGASPVILAIQHGQIDVLLLLLHWDVGSVEISDINGCTPVHWAAYKGDLSALRILHYTQKGVGFDLADRQGMTALHRAVSHYSAVVFLVKEAYVEVNKTVNEGLRAVDLARTGGHHATVRFLEIFKDNEEISIRGKVEALKSRERQQGYILPLIYWVYVVVLIYTYWFILNTRSIIFTILAGPAVGSYLWLMLGDPGHREKRLHGSSAIEQYQSYLDKKWSTGDEEDFQLSTLCLTCRDWKSLRTKHCGKCNKCCDGFDHCCPWINTDVAAKNHRLFISMLFINFITHLAHTACVLYDLPSDNFILLQIFASAVNQPLLFGLLTVASFFLPFAGIMLMTQLRIVATNMNTNELLNMHRYSHFWQPNNEEGGNAENLAQTQKNIMMNHLQAVAFVNPFDKGVLKNCLHFWTGDENFSHLALPIPKRIGNFQIKQLTCCDTHHDQRTGGDIELGGLGSLRE